MAAQYISFDQYLSLNNYPVAQLPLNQDYKPKTIKRGQINKVFILSYLLYSCQQLLLFNIKNIGK